MTIQEIEIKYGTDSNYITLHAVKEMDDFTITIKDAYMLVTDNTSNDVKLVIDGFVGLVSGGTQRKEEQKQDSKQPMPKTKATKPKQTRTGRHMWTDDEKREAMRMYAAGKDLDIIVKKFNSTPGSVEKIMQKNGIRRPWPTKGNPSKIEPAAPADEEEPV